MAGNQLIRLIGACLCITHIAFGSSTSNDKTCGTKDCVEAATRMQALMDQTAEPCEDFHQFACGQFLKDRIIPKAKDAIGSFFDIMDSDRIAIKSLLESPVDCPDVDSFEMKMKTLYKSCIDTDAMETHGLVDYTDSYKQDWPTLNTKWNAASNTLQATTEKYMKLFTEVLFSFQLKIKYEGLVGKYILDIQVPSFTHKKNDLLASKKYYTDLAVALGAEKTSADMDAHNVVNLIQELYKNDIPPGGRWNPKITTNPSTLGDMNKKYPYLDWVKAANAMLNTMGITVDATQQVNVVYPKFFEGMETVIGKTNKRIIHNLFGFGHAVKTLKSATKSMRTLWETFQGPQPPRETACVDTVVDLYNVGMAKLMSRTRYTNKAKTFMDTMIANLKAAYTASIQKITWMGDATKQKALLKIKEMGSKIGIRSSKFSDDDLDTYYKKYTVHKNTFTTDYLQNDKQKKVNNLKDLNQGVKDWRWDVSMTIVNAYSWYSTNEIIFPLGIMQPPFFKENYPGYLNYGAVGYFIGHEIGHGFDSNGRNYDEKGRLIQWWTSADETKYNQKAQCYKDQYSGFNVTQVNLMVNGAQSATENIADNLGISQAYEAYKAFVKGLKTKELPLPTLGLTNDQLFFLATAQTWCLKRTDKAMKGRIESSSYAPAEFRNIGMMQNSEDFAKAFKCKKEDYMNPADKCKMW